MPPPRHDENLTGTAEGERRALAAVADERFVWLLADARGMLLRAVDCLTHPDAYTTTELVKALREHERRIARAQGYVAAVAARRGRRYCRGRARIADELREARRGAGRGLDRLLAHGLLGANEATRMAVESEGMMLQRALDAMARAADDLVQREASS